MSSDRTPAEVIAAAFSVGRGVTNSPEALAARVLDTLAAAGFRVVPEPDDTTRAEVEALVELLRGPVGLSFASKAMHLTVADACRAANALAAAYLSGDPEEGQ